ncbi:MAG: hypothetical protein ACO3FI_05775 [Cyclobacteriaceae bacterium]
MNLQEALEAYAENSEGQFIRYNDEISFVIAPVSGGRNQKVVVKLVQNELYNRKMIHVSSQVCTLSDGPDFRRLLEQSAHFNYCRFVIREGNLEVESVAEATSFTAPVLGEMITETANLADQFEMIITGNDRN